MQVPQKRRKGETTETSGSIVLPSQIVPYGITEVEIDINGYGRSTIGCGQLESVYRASSKQISSDGSGAILNSTEPTSSQCDFNTKSALNIGKLKPNYTAIRPGDFRSIYPFAVPENAPAPLPIVIRLQAGELENYE